MNRHYNLYDNLYFEQIEIKCNVSRYLIEIVILPLSYNSTYKISWWSQWRSNLNLNQRRLHRLTSPGLRNIVQEPYKILYLMKVNNKSFIKCHVFYNLLNCSIHFFGLGSKLCNSHFRYHQHHSQVSPWRQIASSSFLWTPWNWQDIHHLGMRERNIQTKRIQFYGTWAKC